MKLSNILGIQEQALRVVNQRHELIASNIANADTPGYKARDIDFREVLGKQAVPRPDLKATQPGHFSTPANRISANYVYYRTNVQPSLDGNTVDAQQEQVKFAENYARFEATMRFLDGRVKNIEKAFSGK